MGWTEMMRRIVSEGWMLMVGAEEGEGEVEGRSG
jgi:hypothetical protein